MNRTHLRRLAGFVVAAASAAHAQTVADLGPAPLNTSDVGRIAAIACGRTDANRIFVAAADGGIWRSTNGGATWTPLADDFPTTAMGAIVIDPFNENVVYAGSGEGNHANHSRYGLGLFKSSDGGDTWTQLAVDTFAGRCFTKLVADPRNPGTLYASITRAGGFPEMAAAKKHPLRAGPLGVFKSTDAGVTWTQLTGGLPANAATDIAIDPANSQNLFAAIGYIFGSADNGIYRSRDAGATWTRLGGGLPSGAGIGRISLAVAPTNAQRLYALVTNAADASGNNATTRGGYRSDNGGDTWTPINPGSIQATYGWYLSTVAVSPTSADTVIMGGLELVRSTNAGASFSDITPPHVDLHALAFDASGCLLAGDDGGLHRSTNLGSSWTSLNAGLGTIQFYAGLSTSPTNENVVLGGTQDNGTNLRSTASRTWTQVIGGDGGWTQIDQTNPQRMFGEYQGTGNLFQSTSGGGGFFYSGNGIGGRNCFLPPYVLDPANPRRALYGTERVYVTTNGGSSWTPLSGDIAGGSGAIRSLAIAPSDSRYVYAATNTSRVAVSTDSGATFTTVLTDADGWPRTTRELFVDPRDPRTVYLAGATFGAPRVRRSIDAGSSWQRLDAGLPDIPVNTVAADTRRAPHAIYAGTDAGLYASFDGGASWSRFAPDLPNACIIDLILDEPRERLIVGTQGRGAWTIALECPADFNNDGAVDSDDFFDFLNAYNAGDIAADFNGDGTVDSDDFFDFLNVYNTGC